MKFKPLPMLALCGAMSLGFPAASPASLLNINEVNSITGHFGSREYVEIYNNPAGAPGNISLNGVVLVLYSGTKTTSGTITVHEANACYCAIPLDGHTLASGEFFVVGDRGVPGVDLILPFLGDSTLPPAVAADAVLYNAGLGNLLQGDGPAGVALYRMKPGPITSASQFLGRFVNDAAITASADLLDAVVYAGNKSFGGAELLRDTLYASIPAAQRSNHLLWEKIDAPFTQDVQQNFDKPPFFHQTDAGPTALPNIYAGLGGTSVFPQGYSLSRLPDGGTPFQNGPQRDGYNSPQFPATSTQLAARNVIISGADFAAPGDRVPNTFMRAWPTPGLTNASTKFLVVDILDTGTGNPAGGTALPVKGHERNESDGEVTQLRITRDHISAGAGFTGARRSFSKLAVNAANYPAVDVFVEIEDTTEVRFAGAQPPGLGFNGINHSIARVTIPAGVDSVIVNLSPRDDEWADGAQTCIISAREDAPAPTLVPDADWLIIRDDGGGAAASIVINEVNARPLADANDPAGGGTVNSQDEFVEIVNRGAGTVDLTGFTLVANDAATVHTFPPGSQIKPGQSLAVFSQVNRDLIGASPLAGIFGQTEIEQSLLGSEVLDAFGLRMTDTGDTVRLVDGAFNEVVDFKYINYPGGSLRRAVETGAATATDTAGHAYPPLHVNALPNQALTRFGPFRQFQSPGSFHAESDIANVNYFTLSNFLTPTNWELSLKTDSIVENAFDCIVGQNNATLLTLTRPTATDTVVAQVLLDGASHAIFQGGAAHPDAALYPDFHRIILTFNPGDFSKSVVIHAVNNDDPGDEIVNIRAILGTHATDTIALQVRDRGALTDAPQISGIYPHAGTETREWIDMLVPPGGVQPLTDVVMVLYDGADGLAYASIDLTGNNTVGGFFRVGDTGTHANLVVPGFDLRNGNGAVALYRKYADAPAPAIGDEVTLKNLLHHVFYVGNSGTVDPALLSDFFVAGTQRIVDSTETIGDKVFVDINNNGVFDDGEGIGNARLTFFGDFDGDGCQETSQAYTDTNGTYQSSHLSTATNYTVRVDPTSLDPELVQTVDPDGVLDNMTAFVLAGATLTKDFGYRGPGSIGDKVFFDTNKNGAFDLGEGLPNVDVELIGDVDGDGDTDFNFAVTDATGTYTFSGMQTGAGVIGQTYSVEVTPPPDLILTVDPDDPIALPPNFASVTLFNATPTTTAMDFGYQGLGIIGDRIYFDTNNNNSFDPGEGVGGAVVSITGDFNGDGSVDPALTTTSAPDGVYGFSGLRTTAAGVLYTVTVAPPPGLVASTDPDGVADNTVVVQLISASPVNNNIDFGYRGPGSIGDKVFFDTNGNASFDAGEGIPGATVSITGDFNGDGSVDASQSTVTDATGTYGFGALRVTGAGVPYTIAVVPPVGLVQTVDPDGTLNNGTVVTVTIAAPANVAADFGYRGIGAVGDKVFFDTNNNNSFDAGEGLGGITVNLTGDFNGDGSNDPALTTTTGATGTYGFATLRTTAAGVLYTVTVVAPAGLVPSTDPDGVADNTVTFQLTTAAPANTNIDLGYRGPGAVGDKVFFDTNSNGSFDAGEGIPGLTMSLTGDFNGDGSVDPAITTTTDGTGTYGFAALRTSGAGVTYTVAVTVPAGLIPSFDPDGVPNNNSTATLTNALPANNTRDFGYRGPGSVGDKVFFDTNSNNAFDAGEGLGGVTVSLTGDFNGDGSVDPAVTTTTDATGTYGFSSLRTTVAGVAYSVTVTVPAGLTQSFDPDGTLDNAATALLTNATPGNATRDFGYRGNGALGDKVFFDLNNNNAFDAGEGIPGLTVSVTGDFNGDGSVDPAVTTTTNGIGTYAFTTLRTSAAGVAYTVAVTVPAGLTQSFDPDGTLNNSSVATLTSAAPVDDTRDFGYRGPGSVGDKVFFDLNSNNAFDAGEGLGGVTVSLTGDFNGDGSVDPAVTTTTDATGTYGFSGLRTTVAGVTYTVTVTVPPGLTQTFDPDGVINNSSTALLTNAAPANATRDFGYQGPGAVGDTIFIDVDNSGTPGAGEGLGGVAVSLVGDFNGDGAVDPAINAVTNAAGVYSFAGLRVTAAGVAYTVTVTPPVGLTQTVDPDGTLNNGSVSTLTIAAPSDLTRDFGYRGLGSVGDRIFFDVNNNNAFDAGEGIPGLSIQLLGDFNGDGATESSPTTTDATGAYGFSGLRTTAAGVVYTVAVGVPVGLVQTFDPDGTLNNSSPINLTDAVPADATRDFGYRGPGSVGDRIFQDVNGNSAFDVGEGIAGVTVLLTGDFNGDGSIDPALSTATSADGLYEFTALRTTAAGVPYTAAVNTATLPAGFINSFDPDDGNDNQAVANLTNAATADVTRDFGYQGAGVAGGRIFSDNDESGGFSAGDPIFPNVAVALTGDIDGDGVNETFNTTTNAAGQYSFAGLRVTAAGVPYTIVVTPPMGAFQSHDPDATLDNMTVATLTTAAPVNNNLNFGYFVEIPFPGSALLNWRQQHFGSSENTGDAADLADPDKDGVRNLAEFGFGLNPLVADAGGLPSAQQVGNFLEIRFTAPADVAGILYGADASDDLTSWAGVTDTGTGAEHVFRIPIGFSERFLRLKVSVSP